MSWIPGASPLLWSSSASTCVAGTAGEGVGWAGAAAAARASLRPASTRREPPAASRCAAAQDSGTWGPSVCCSATRVTGPNRQVLQLHVCTRVHQDAHAHVCIAHASTHKHTQNTQIHMHTHTRTHTKARTHALSKALTHAHTHTHAHVLKQHPGDRCGGQEPKHVAHKACGLGGVEGAAASDDGCAVTSQTHHEGIRVSEGRTHKVIQALPKQHALNPIHPFLCSSCATCPSTPPRLPARLRSMQGNPAHTSSVACAAALSGEMFVCASTCTHARTHARTHSRTHAVLHCWTPHHPPITWGSLSRLQMSGASRMPGKCCLRTWGQDGQ